MNYVEISKVAQEARIVSGQIFELYRSLGANLHFPVDVQNVIRADIDNLQKDLTKLESKLVKLTTN